MVLTPNEAKQPTHDERQQVAQLETRLDRALREDYDGQPVAIAMSLTQGVRQIQLDRLLDRYRAAGWEVRVQQDQRDGNYLEFKPTRETYGPYAFGTPQFT